MIYVRFKYGDMIESINAAQAALITNLVNQLKGEPKSELSNVSLFENYDSHKSLSQKGIGRLQRQANSQWSIYRSF